MARVPTYIEWKNRTICIFVCRIKL